MRTETKNFTIRPATIVDAPIILQLIRDLATYERAPNEVAATEEQLVDVLFGERPVAEVLLAFEDEMPIGFAVFFHNFSTWLGRPGLYLEDLFVKPEARGKGYGRALLIHLAKIARDRGCGRMEWAVLDWNEPAIQFYKKIGAVPMKEWRIFRMTSATRRLVPWSAATDALIGFAFRDLIRRRVLPRSSVRKKMATGDFFPRKRSARRVVGIETRRSSSRRKLKPKAARCA